MTVLEKYQRLETEAIWRPDAQAQRRDVIISIGDATLTISAANGTALAHWSLPAITRVNTGETPAIYAPAEDAPDTLEVADPEMIGALEQVLHAVRKGAAAPSARRSSIMAIIALATVLGLAIWGPGAITRYTAALVPDAARTAIGADLLAEMERVTGAPCAAPAGLRALAALQDRLFPNGATKLVVMPSALSETAALPGGAILIGHSLVEDFELPEALAGFVLAEDTRRATTDPLTGLLEAAGLRASLGLLTSARLPNGALPLMAENVVAKTLSPVADTDLIARMKAAQIASAPYGFARDISGEKTAQLINASQVTQPELLSDGQWIALQGICGE